MNKNTTNDNTKNARVLRKRWRKRIRRKERLRQKKIVGLSLSEAVLFFSDYSVTNKPDSNKSMAKKSSYSAYMDRIHWISVDQLTHPQPPTNSRLPRKDWIGAEQKSSIGCVVLAHIVLLKRHSAQVCSKRRHDCGSWTIHLLCYMAFGKLKRRKKNTSHFTRLSRSTFIIFGVHGNGDCEKPNVEKKLYLRRPHIISGVRWEFSGTERKTSKRRAVWMYKRIESICYRNWKE